MENNDVKYCPILSFRDGSGVPRPCMREGCACWIAVQGSPFFPQNQGRGYCGLMHWDD